MAPSCDRSALRSSADSELLRLGAQTVKYAATADGPMPRGAEVWVRTAPSSTSASVRAVETCLPDPPVHPSPSCPC